MLVVKVKYRGIYIIKLVSNFINLRICKLLITILWFSNLKLINLEIFVIILVFCNLVFNDLDQILFMLFWKLNVIFCLIEVILYKHGIEIFIFNQL